MAGAVTLKPTNNWQAEMRGGLRDALNASMTVIGRTGEQACRHALILMSQSAGKMVRKDRRSTRPIQRDEHGEYVEVYTQKRREPYHVYKWMFSDDNPQERIPGTWQNARKIGNIGLGKRSWLWGLRRLGAKQAATRPPIPGMSSVYTISGETASGYVKVNRLSYMVKALEKNAPGWERLVEIMAGNKIMAQAKRRLERRWKAQMKRRERMAGRAIQSYFLKGL